MTTAAARRRRLAHADPVGRITCPCHSCRRTRDADAEAVLKKLFPTVPASFWRMASPTELEAVHKVMTGDPVEEVLAACRELEAEMARPWSGPTEAARTLLASEGGADSAVECRPLSTRLKVAKNGGDAETRTL